MCNDESQVLNIKTFGCFEVTYNGKAIVRRDDRSSKLSQLFSYFVYRRGEMIPQNEIAANLLQNDDNALNIFKNLVYRLRKLLAGAGVSGNVILYSSGCYGFSSTISCACDFNEFTALASSLEKKSVSFARQRDDFLKIMRIYGGDFLQGSCSEAWALSAALRYQQKFEQCVLTVAAAAQRADAYTEILDGLHKATTLYVYNENIAAAYMTALFETKNSAEALRQYEKLSAALLNDLGVEPCEAVKQVYHRILVGDDSAVESVSALRDAIVEDEAFDGAYYCSREIFKDIYRLSVRKAVRAGQSVFLMMCTVRERDGERPETGARMRAVSESLSSALHSSCRSGDVYTRISPAQFVLMLTDITKENCEIVAERLRRNFYGMPKMKHTQLLCEFISGLDIERLLK